MKILFCRLLLPLFMLLSVKSEAEEKSINICDSYYMEKQIICHKLPMEADGIVRLSKIEVYPEFLDEYIKYAVEVGEISLLTEPGVLTMYAVSEKDNPCKVTILETYASKAAYEQHIASQHFQKYKQGTLHMVKSLLLSDQIPLIRIVISIMLSGDFIKVPFSNRYHYGIPSACPFLRLS